MKISKKTKEFLKESNAIERVYDDDSLQQAIYAWEYLIGEDVLTSGVILKTHKILMLHQNLLPNEKGYFRKCAVYIGGREAIDYNVIPDRIDLWIGTMEMFLKESRIDKVNRWLGFIQGVLWCCGVYTINELREHNRP